MASYFVNIDNAYSATYGDGTLSNPFNISQFIGHLTSAVSNNDNFYIRGYYSNIGAGSIVINLGSYCEPAISASNVSFKAWNLDLYGPWKIEGDLVLIQTNYAYNYFSNFKVSDFVFSNFKAYRNNNPENEPWYFINGIFKDTTDFNSVVSSSPIYVQGCTLAGGITLDDSYISPQSAGVYQFDDCVFYNAPLSDNYVKSITFNGCVFSGTSAYNLSALQTPTSAIFINDCTFNWSTTALLPTISAITSANRNLLDFDLFGIEYTQFSERKNFWKSVDYLLSGAYGTYRRGPGCFYFKNNVFYVDFNALSSSNGDGTYYDPLNYVDFMNYCSASYDYDKFKIKGLAYYGDFLNFGGADYILFDSWDLERYGPWRIVFYSSAGIQSATNLHLKNGMIQYFGTSGLLRLNASDYQNVFINVSGNKTVLGLSNNETAYLRGSTLIMSSGTFIEVTNPSNDIMIVGIDSCFDLSSFCGNLSTSASAFFDNCAFINNWVILKGNMFSGYGQLNMINSQYDWIPPDWPNIISGTKYDYAYSRLTSGDHVITVSGSWHYNKG